jgi:hypothetical protein
MSNIELPDVTKSKYQLDRHDFNPSVKETIKDIHERYFSLSSDPGAILVGIVAYFDTGTGTIPVDSASISLFSLVNTHRYDTEDEITSPTRLDRDTRLVKLGVQARGANVVDCLMIGSVTHIVVGNEKRGDMYREVYRSVLEGRPHIVSLDWARECCRQETFVGEF